VIAPRWKKVWADLSTNRTRAALVVAAMVVGIWGLGSVTVSYAVLTRQLADNYSVTNPASATLWATGLDDAQVQEIRALPAVQDAELRTVVRGRVLMEPDRWWPLWLFIVEDFEGMTVSTFTPETGAWPPADGEILIERDGQAFLPVGVGEELVVTQPGGARQTLRLSGLVHDAGQAPAHMEHWMYGYATRATAEGLGWAWETEQLKFTVAERADDEAHIRATAGELRGWLEERGSVVSRVDVPPPGRHPHQNQLESLLFLQGSMGLMALLLSGVLIVNMLSVLLAEQVRQIGIMKAIGARPGQIRVLYYGMVLAMTVAALALGLPLGIASGRGYSAFVATELNFDILSWAIPPGYYLSQVAAAIALALAAATVPILRGTRVTVRDALNSYGLGGARLRVGGLALALGRINGSWRPWLLSLRNTFRRKGRLALTVGTLAAGLGLMMVALNMGASLSRSLRSESESRHYDVAVYLDRPTPLAALMPAIDGTDGVESSEAWIGGMGYLVQHDGTQSNRFGVVAPPADTDRIELPMLQGSWLDGSTERPPDSPPLVMNQGLHSLHPNLQLGDELTLRIGETTSAWTLAGIAKEMGSPNQVFVRQRDFTAVTGMAGAATSVLVVTRGHDSATQIEVSQNLERTLEAGGFPVASVLCKAEGLQIIEDHLIVITIFLTMMSLLVLAVGGLGLLSTMSINVLERTREIGVMRAIGAGSARVIALVVAEGELVGLLSWLVALALAWPATVVVAGFFGDLIFHAPLVVAFSPAGIAVTAVVVVVFTAVAAAWPARSISRRSVRDALAYE